MPIRPYIREARRIRSLRPILEQEIMVKDFQGGVHRGDNARAAFMHAFQQRLLQDGIALQWYIDVPLLHPAFRAVQTLATAGIPVGSPTDLLFRPDDPITLEEWGLWSNGGTHPNAPTTFTGTRGEAALALLSTRNVK